MRTSILKLGKNYAQNVSSNIFSSMTYCVFVFVRLVYDPYTVEYSLREVVVVLIFIQEKQQCQVYLVNGHKPTDKISFLNIVNMSLCAHRINRIVTGCHAHMSEVSNLKWYCAIFKEHSHAIHEYTIRRTIRSCD